MTHIEIDAETVVVHVQGLDKLWALKSQLRIPIAHVSDVAQAAAEARLIFQGLRAPGTHVPGLITAGTFYTTEGRVFWDVHRSKRAIAITLHDDYYAKIVIDVKDPAAEIEKIKAVIAARKTVVESAP